MLFYYASASEVKDLFTQAGRATELRALGLKINALLAHPDETAALMADHALTLAARSALLVEEGDVLGQFLRETEVSDVVPEGS